LLQTRRCAEAPTAKRVEDLPPDSEYAKTLALVGSGKCVLDFGCGTGSMSRLLAAAGNRVTAIEIDPEHAAPARLHCESVIVADLDTRPLAEILPGGRFDVALFGDVLERLRDPWRVLDETRAFLAPGGYAVMSIPNVAHWSIRLSLLRGEFEYRDVGLLDDDHIRFFTARSIQTLCLRAGYEIEAIDRTIQPLFAERGGEATLERAAFPAELIEQIKSDPDHDTLEFLLKARPLDDERKIRRMVEGIASAEARAERALQQLTIETRRPQQTEADLRRRLAEATAERAAALEVVETKDRALAELEERYNAAREESQALREQARRRHVPAQSVARLQVLVHELAAALFGSDDVRTRAFERPETGDASTIASKLGLRLEALRGAALELARNHAAAKAENRESHAGFGRQIATLRRELAAAKSEILAMKRAIAAAEHDPNQTCANCRDAAAALQAWRAAYGALHGYVARTLALELATVRRDQAIFDNAITQIYRSGWWRLKSVAGWFRLRPVR
jgi:2-polyprenyl-3-methyl-5-hydroxy-6-metoxy-1,4-benzoquinol methylase